MITQLLRFDDDSLPGARKALIAVTTMLLLVHHHDLAFALDQILFVHSTSTTVDPTYVLCGLVFYFGIRQVAIAGWYIRLTKNDVLKASDGVKELIESLSEFRALNVSNPKLQKATETLLKFDIEPMKEDVDAFRAQLQRAQVFFSKGLSSFETQGEFQSIPWIEGTNGRSLIIEGHKLDQKLIGQLESKVAKFSHCTDRLQLDFGGTTDDMLSHSKALNEEIQSLHASFSNLAATIASSGVYQKSRKIESALKNLDLKDLTASQWKNLDTFVFGLALPLFYAVGTLLWVFGAV